jgi:hypothetical protein
MGGDFRGATAMHPLWFLVLPFVGGVGLLECGLYLRDGVWGKVAGRRGVRGVGLGLVALLVGVWILREWGAFGGPVSVV